MGKNSDSNLAGLLGQLLPLLQSAISKSQSDHLPKSVLDQGKINTLLKNTQKQQSNNKQIEKLTKSALKKASEVASSGKIDWSKFQP